VSRAAKTVLRVWLALFALLALTTTIAFLPLGSFNLPIALGIAVAKALLVLWFFMELKGSAGLTRAFAAAAFFWLLILIVLTWADYSHRADVHVPLDANPLPSR
jgi:cytochrome c oxidase subunit IV